MTNIVVTLRRLLDLHPEGLRIGPYQRHYVWGQERDSAPDSVTYLTDCLLEAYAHRREYFLQSITVHCGHLVDGQQRLTFLLLLLRHLGHPSPVTLHYSNRPEAARILAALPEHPELAELSEQPEQSEQPGAIVPGVLSPGVSPASSEQPGAIVPGVLLPGVSPASSEQPGVIVPGVLSPGVSPASSEDAYFMLRTLGIFRDKLAGIDRDDFAAWLLDNVQLLYIPIPPDNDAVLIYKMMNGSKAPMQPTDIIKADIMRIASDIDQPSSNARSLRAMRTRYASEWDQWVRWWNNSSVRAYYGDLNPEGLSLLLRLALRPAPQPLDTPLTYSEFATAVGRGDDSAARAKHIFHRLRGIQHRIEGAYADTACYNCIKAILLLQQPHRALEFLRMYFVECSIPIKAESSDTPDLETYYKLSFLGMDIDAIRRGDSPDAYFADLYEALSQPDVYHSEAKRDVYHLLLRLNIDEDIKLGRNFDFSVWSNRSLEHIYSKSKVWHLDDHGHLLDGNDNPIRLPRKQVESDPSYLRRDRIVTRSGIPLSEHCIGNLVLLYGQNNSEFGNSTFEQKKTMFLTPGTMSAFRSRNLLHSVCVFAGNTWTHRSIVDNYTLTLKNLKIYYGYK